MTFRTKQPDVATDPVWQRLQEVLEARDTPSLISRVAADRFFIRLCRAVADPVSEEDRQMVLRAKAACAGRGCSYETVERRMGPVALALGLTGRGVRQKDLYALLGLSDGASQDEIRRAYRSRVREVHPDTAEGAADTEAFVSLRTAYQTLVDVDTRRAYDESRHAMAGWKEGPMSGDRDLEGGTGRLWRARNLIFAGAGVLALLLFTALVVDVRQEEISLREDLRLASKERGGTDSQVIPQVGDAYVVPVPAGVSEREERGALVKIPPLDRSQKKTQERGEERSRSERWKEAPPSTGPGSLPKEIVGREGSHDDPAPGGEGKKTVVAGGRTGRSEAGPGPSAPQRASSSEGIPGPEGMPEAGEKRQELASKGMTKASDAASGDDPGRRPIVIAKAPPVPTEPPGEAGAVPPSRRPGAAGPDPLGARAAEAPGVHKGVPPGSLPPTRASAPSPEAPAAPIKASGHSGGEAEPTAPSESPESPGKGSNAAQEAAGRKAQSIEKHLALEKSPMAHGQGDLAQSPPPEGAGTPPGKASAPSETVAGAQPQTPRDVEEPPRNALDRIKAFLSAYTRTYESMNLSAFQSFFDPQATENGTPFRTLLAKYKENYARLDALKYRIDLTECNEDRSLGVVRVKGKFCMRWRSGGEWDETCGTISLDLLPHGDSFKVKTLEYRYGT